MSSPMMYINSKLWQEHDTVFNFNDANKIIIQFAHILLSLCTLNRNIYAGNVEKVSPITMQNYFDDNSKL